MALQEVLDRLRRGSGFGRGTTEPVEPRRKPRRLIDTYGLRAREPVAAEPLEQPRPRFTPNLRAPKVNADEMGLPGKGGVRAAIQANKEPRRRVSLLSREGRQAHPVASAVVAGSLYGSRAPEVLQRRDLQEAEEARRQSEHEDRMEAREARRAAIAAPPPTGYIKDASGQLRESKEPKKPSEEEIRRMAAEGHVWSETEQKFIRGRSARGASDRPNLWTNKPPEGVATPPGHKWVPGKGFEKEQREGRTRHQIETSIRSLEGQKRPLIVARDRLKRRQELLSATLASLDPQSDEYRNRQAELDDLDTSVAQMDSSLGDIEARSEGDYGELQEHLPAKEGMTWERYYALNPKQRKIYRESFKMPPGPDPGGPEKQLAAESP